MRRPARGAAAGFAVGVASVLMLATVGTAGPSYPDDTYDVTITGDTAEVKGKGDEKGKGRGFQVSKSKKGNPTSPSIEGHVKDKASGKTASFVLVEGGGVIDASRGNRHVILTLTQAGVEIFSYVGDRPKWPEVPKLSGEPKPGTQSSAAPKHPVEAKCAASDPDCIARAIRKTLHDLSPEEVATLIVLLRDDLKLVRNGDKILETLRRLAGS